MGRRQIIQNWTEATKLQLSPAATPPWNLQNQDDEQLQFLRDRHYFMHGEIVAFTAIGVFVLFLLLLVIPCVRRTITIPSSGSESSQPTRKRNYLRLMPRKRKADDHEQHPGPPEQFDEKEFGVPERGFSDQSSSSC